MNGERHALKINPSRRREFFSNFDGCLG